MCRRERERVRALICPYFNFGLNCVYWQVCVCVCVGVGGGEEFLIIVVRTTILNFLRNQLVVSK